MVSTAETGSLLLEYALKISLYTLGMIGVMYAAYFYLKGKRITGPVTPRVKASERFSLGGLLKSLRLPESNGLRSDTAQAGAFQNEAVHIESHVTLSPHKAIYVLRTGRERFLVADTHDTVSLLAHLNDAEPPHLAQELQNNAATNGNGACTAPQMESKKPGAALNNSRWPYSNGNRPSQARGAKTGASSPDDPLCDIHTDVYKNPLQPGNSSSPFSHMLKQILPQRQDPSLNSLYSTGNPPKIKRGR